MTQGMTRREWLVAAGAAATAIGAIERGGLMRPAHAEKNFTVSLSGGPWGDAQIEAYITGTGFEKQSNLTVAYDRAQDNVRAAKAMARCGDPEFTVVEALNQQAVLLAAGGCLRDYDLDVVTNYKQLGDGAREAPRGGLSNYFGAQVIMAIGLVYNIDELPKGPGGFDSLADAKFKGKIGIPSFGWVGQQWMYAMNEALGGPPDNVDRGLKFVADLVKRNQAVVLENSDAAQKAFQQREIVAMPFWNGRVYFMRKAGIPVAIAYPKGWIQTGNGYVLSKNTAHAAAANRFINNTLDGELQLQMSRRFGYPPTNGTVKLPPDLESIRLPTEVSDLRARLDYSVMIQKTAENQARWNKEVLS